MHCVSPALDAPALFSADLALLQVRKLPEVVHRVQLANLHEPGPDSLHDFSAGLEAPPPVCLPFEQVARVQSVRTKLEQAAQLAWRSGWPEGKLLHERGALSIDKALELCVELGEFGVVLDGVQ